MELKGKRKRNNEITPGLHGFGIDGQEERHGKCARGENRRLFFPLLLSPLYATTMTTTTAAMTQTVFRMFRGLGAANKTRFRNRLGTTRT